MIDVHSHILPNIDDGSRSIDETFNLIKEAKAAGFDGIICTSHYMENYYETNRPEREVWINAIHENLSAKDIDMQLYIGNEIYMSDNIIKLLEDGKASTLNDTSYVLFELPMNAEPLNLYDTIYEMQQYKIVPILAHPERYSFVQTDPELIYDLIEKGVLMQSNYGSIIGQYGKKAQIININLEDVDDIYAKVIVKIMCKFLFDYSKSLEQRASIPFHLFLEEAHRYIQKDNDTFLLGYNIFDRIAKEGRKYGVILDIISQRPVEISDTVIAQCSNFLIFKMTHPLDIKYISEMLPNISADIIEKQKTLQPGTCVSFGSAFKIPMIVKMEMPNPMPYSSNCNVSSCWR